MRMTDWMADHQLVPALNIWRQDMRLAPLSRYIPSTKRRAVAFFPPWFDDLGAMAASEVFQGDFVYHHASETGRLPSRIERFLCDDAPTVVVTFGTGVAHVRARYEKLVDAFAGRPLRAIFLTRFDVNTPRNASDNVLVEPSADLALLLPRCALLVHHGGIGTVAQAMRAGVPQLVIPITYDQPDNGFRVRELGVGDLLEGAWDSASVQSRIEGAIANADHVKLRQIRDRIISRDGTVYMADILERVAVPH
jgi:UDP:flavonoid glycosyltransferase YjiC (YdhE family)